MHACANSCMTNAMPSGIMNYPVSRTAGGLRSVCPSPTGRAAKPVPPPGYRTTHDSPSRRRCADGLQRAHHRSMQPRRARDRQRTAKASTVTGTRPRLMRTFRPNGSVCSRQASSRTILPRSLVECAASAASRINWYRNNPIARARSARTFASSRRPPPAASFAVLETHDSAQIYGPIDGYGGVDSCCTHSPGQPGANNRPPDTATAVSASETPGRTNRRPMAAASAPIATTAVNPRPAASGITGSASTARSQIVNTDRTASTRSANRRS